MPCTALNKFAADSQLVVIAFSYCLYKSSTHQNTVYSLAIA